MKLPKPSFKATPPGKRTVRVTVRGNIVGYVSGRHFWEFGSDFAWNRHAADKWAAGAELSTALGYDDDA